MTTVHRFKDLHELDPDQRAELDAMLLDGVPASTCVEKIQGDWQLLAGKKPATVKKMLERYRAQDLKTKVVQALADKVSSNHVVHIHKKLNAIEELTNLAVVQKGRFEKGLLTESKSPLLMGSVSAEAKLLKDILTDLGKLQLETGIIQRAPKKLTGTMVDEDGNVNSFEWTEEQAKLYHEIEAFEKDGTFQVAG